MATDTSKFKERLEKMLTDISEELKTIGIHNPNNPSDWIATPEKGVMEPDPNDAADRVEDWDEKRATMAELETRYNNIVRALERINEGTYETCEVCGKTIEAERHEANPAARTDKAHRDQETNHS